MKPLEPAMFANSPLPDLQQLLRNSWAPGRGREEESLQNGPWLGELTAPGFKPGTSRERLAASHPSPKACQSGIYSHFMPDFLLSALGVIICLPKSEIFRKNNRNI